MSGYCVKKMSDPKHYSISQGNFISTEPDTSGFDLSSGGKWIYPENYPRRDYQFNIVQTALYNNTLVCLPTGLGKTFIAAVVMYNFWRWYPQGRVVFLAPTKPLVAQQINACHEIMGIPSNETIELTGAINQTKRAVAWSQKRVIFATPQTFQKDLQNDYIPYNLIKCIVIDEAHKALGKHSYCEIVRMLYEKNKFFRILALSATPGSKIDHVREVIQNLLISELELRDDTSPDITPYTNDRSMEKIIVALDQDLNDYKDRYINIMDPHVRILIKSHILQGSAANISKGRIFLLMKQYESRPNKAQNHGTIMKTLNILLTMYHAYELLLKHGLRAFYHFYLNHSDKFWLNAEVELKLMLEDIKVHIGDFPVIQPSDDGNIPDIPDNIVFGHSKFKKLQELLVNHFKSFSLQNKSTRAIVFVEYRDIVNEVYVLLLQTRPLIRPQMFVGQAGQKQKQQLAALEDFRNNKVNVLISTSVGEEGLDVGEVDLIVCFDISTSTPTRLVQRMGRTGRKRSGRVVLLLTEGKEVLNITPECLPMFIKALPKTPKVRGRRALAQKVAKPAAEKKPRKKKKDAIEEDDNNLIEHSTSKSPCKPSQSKSPTKKTTTNQKFMGNNQSSMVKFLTDQRQPKKSLYPQETDSGFAEDFQLPEDRYNPYSYIHPYEVKLLTSDHHALEFLTLCAMKKSEESSSMNTLELDLNWIPPRSPVTKDMFRDLTIPSMESLECISNLKLNEIPSIESDGDSLFPDSLQIRRQCSYDSNVYNDFTQKDENMDGNYFDKFEDVKPKYVIGEGSMAVQKKSVKENIEIAAADFFCTFDESKRNSIVLSKQPLQKNFDEMEISAADFSSTFFDNKPVNSTIKRDDDPKRDSQSLSNITPANVEVDFENLLDEYTESETSENPALLTEGENIFDDLLEDDSTDEDLFAEQNVTVVPNLNETVRAKRSASVSPKRESPSKKQKISRVDSDSLDNESTIMATSPKPSKSVLSDKIVSSVKEEEIDSEEDIFDGLDFDETQFTGEKMANDTFRKEMSISPVFSREDKNKSLVFQDTQLKKDMSKSPISTDHEKNALLDGENEDFESRMIVSLVCSIEDKNKSLSKSFALARENENKSLVFENIEQEVQRSASPVFSKQIISKSQEAKKEILAIQLNDDDWFDDDFDFIPVEKKVSNFFPPKTSSSSGWINARQSQQSQQKRKDLSVKSWCTNSKKTDNSKMLTEIERSALQFSSLKPTTNKDKDVFAMPVALKLDKKNQIPVWKQRLNTIKNNGSISPGLRKYRSESDLCSSVEKARKKVKKRRRPRARKRLASRFIDQEAEVSSDYNTSEGSSGDEKLDDDLDSFVSYTQDVSDATDMKAHYLQTINKSPIRAGAFMIKEIRRKIPDTEIFSQPVAREEIEESYLYDSFCVGDETQVNGNENELEESILEKMESNLESRRRNIRKKKEKARLKFNCLKKKKVSSSRANDSSSEDEAEILRRQIMEESIMLKQ
ncbi:Fanconi anemia group M protein isoform X2 [Phymastichus coffea]|uniref:Fanconi anemia group M protein isoform X2 n=1 Tax=Phymastichus coffea TaxID=108790 RepID=UPI00273CE079|nr:Fanconi anemia group M protein isoform X2 [Phymastichus coffea]